MEEQTKQIKQTEREVGKNRKRKSLYISIVIMILYFLIHIPDIINKSREYWDVFVIIQIVFTSLLFVWLILATIFEILDLKKK